MADLAPAALLREPKDPFTVPLRQMRTWNQLERDVSACTECGLCEGRTQAVLGDGNTAADLFVVGEAPGRHEDLTGKPFMGSLGNLLDTVLADVDLQRPDDVYLTTIVKCRPGANQLPTVEQVEACRPYLLEQLRRVQPRVIVTLGSRPTTTLLGRALPIDRISGYRFDFHGATLVPTHEPLDALRVNTQALAALRRDFATAKAVLDGRLASGAEAQAELLARRGLTVQ